MGSKARRNTKESEEGGEKMKMMLVSSGEWEELVKELRELKEEMKGWRSEMKEMRGYLEELRRRAREKDEVEERKGKVWGGEEDAKGEEMRQRGVKEGSDKGPSRKRGGEDGGKDWCRMEKAGLEAEE